MHTYSPFHGHHHHGHHHGHCHSHEHSLLDDPWFHPDDHVRYVYLMQSPGGSGCLGVFLLIKFGAIGFFLLAALIESAFRPNTERGFEAQVESTQQAAHGNSQTQNGTKRRYTPAARPRQSVESRALAVSDSASEKQVTGKLGQPMALSNPAVRTNTFPARSNELATALLDASASKREELIDNYRAAKGVEFTEALAIAAGKLTGDWRARVRDALAVRMTRMTGATLTEFLYDVNREIRLAAALACGAKGNKVHVHELIRLLADDEAMVVQAARASLKAITGLDRGPDVGAPPRDRISSVLAWRTWQETQLK